MNRWHQALQNRIRVLSDLLAPVHSAASTSSTPSALTSACPTTSPSRALTTARAPGSSLVPVVAARRPTGWWLWQQQLLLVLQWRWRLLSLCCCRAGSCRAGRRLVQWRGTGQWTFCSNELFCCPSLLGAVHGAERAPGVHLESS